MPRSSRRHTLFLVLPTRLTGLEDDSANEIPRLRALFPVCRPSHGIIFRGRLDFAVFFAGSLNQDVMWASIRQQVASSTMEG